MRLCAEFLGQHQNLARARHIRPVAIEVGHQPLHLLATGGAIERRLVGELIRRQMHGGIRDAPVPPRLLRAERFHRVGHVLARVPGVERRAFGGIGDGGADDEEVVGHGTALNAPAAPAGATSAGA
jgi:hypothetical protein